MISVYSSRQPEEKKKPSQQDVFLQWNASKKGSSNKEKFKFACRSCESELPDSKFAYCKECYQEENRKKKLRNLGKTNNTNDIESADRCNDCDAKISHSQSTNLVASRYFHFYDKLELEQLVQNNFGDLVLIIDSFVLKNKVHYLILKKKL
jgi:hypothetical protein